MYIYNSISLFSFSLRLTKPTDKKVPWQLSFGIQMILYLVSINSQIYRLKKKYSWLENCIAKPIHIPPVHEVLCTSKQCDYLWDPDLGPNFNYFISY